MKLVARVTHVATFSISRNYRSLGSHPPASRSVDRMRLVEQTDWNDCGAACLATVTGDALADVKRALDVPTPHGQLEAYLDGHPLPNDYVTVLDEPTVRSLARQRRPFVRPRPFERRTLILSVASPARSIDWHAVVLHRGRVLDPQGQFDRPALDRSRCIWATEVYPGERPGGETRGVAQAD